MEDDTSTNPSQKKYSILLATLAGIVAARSTLELGYDGLAQRAGARTADALVSQLTGTSGPEARAITAVGTMMSEPAPWLSEVATRVTAGEVSIGAAAAIQSGLSAPSPTVAADDWRMPHIRCWPQPPRCRPRRSHGMPANCATNSTKPASSTAKPRYATSDSSGSPDKATG